MTTRVRPAVRGVLAVTVLVCVVSSASAQSSAAPVQSDPESASQPVEQTSAARLPGLSTLFKDTMADFRRLPSFETATWAAVGGLASLVSHIEDAPISTNLSPGGRLHSAAFDSGNLVGSVGFQLGGAIAAYTAGRLTHSPRATTVGLDLMQAQIVAQATTFAIKYAVQRTRPDGGTYSFPSGHTSIAFASAAVLEHHFGWKVAIPAYAAASYVAVARIENHRHYLSDVTFGAALGILSARTVTIGRGGSRFGVTPLAAPSGGGVAFTWLNPR